MSREILLFAVCLGACAAPVTDWSRGALSDGAETAAAATTLRFSRELCPPPFVFAGLDVGEGNTRCLLPHDAIIDASLAVAPNVTIDCGGHALLPAETGTVAKKLCSNTADKACSENFECINNATVREGTCTKFGERQKSKPELAFVVESAHGVKLEGCTIGDASAPFDFGVLVLASKTPATANRIVGNVITARYVGVSVVKSDETWIEGNDIRFGYGTHGRGINVFRDCDRNTITGNQIRSSGSIDVRTAMPLVPQGALRAANSRGIFSTELPNAVLNFVFDGALTQVPLTDTMLTSKTDPPTWLGRCVKPSNAALGLCCVEDNCKGLTDNLAVCADKLDCGLRSDSLSAAFHSNDNVYTRNTLDVERTGFGFLVQQTFGMVDLGTDSDIGENLFLSADDGLHFGAGGHDNIQFAGTCTGGPNRFCGNDADCKLDLDGNGVIGPHENLGSCSGASRELRNQCIGARGHRVANNRFEGPTNKAIELALGGMEITVAGNDVSGADTGIALRQNTLQSMIVENNVVRGGRFSFGLDDGWSDLPRARARHYGSVLRWNDATGSSGKPISNGRCANLPQHLCVVGADSDCDNGCHQGACLRTERPCEGDGDCAGPGPGGVTGACQLALHFDADLAQDGPGNYWGRSCTDSEGFREFSSDPDLAPYDSPAADIVDFHPYGEPIANVDSRPPSCR